MAFIKVLFLLCLVSSSAHAWSWDQIDHSIQTQICTYIVGKIEDDINGAACDWVVTEVTGYAAALLSETGVAELVEDPIIAAVADKMCDKALSYAESHTFLGPDEICQDIGVPWSSRRNRRDVPNATSAAQWTASTTARYLKLRSRKVQNLGKPVAVFPDGSIGYCYFNVYDGSHTCMDPGVGKKFANATRATKWVTPNASNSLQVGSQTPSSPSSESNTNAAAIALSVIFAVAFLGCALYIVVLKTQVAKLEMAKNNPHRLLDEDAYATAN